jgi:para-nitrobenzyl esterase
MRVPTGPVGDDVAISQDDMWTPVEQLREHGRQVAADLGCGAATRRVVLACLREVEVEKLLPHASTFGIASGTPTLPENPETAAADGRFHRVPVLSGNTRDESRYTTMLVEYFTGPITGQRYDALLEQAFGTDAGKVRAVYSAAEYGSPSLAFAAMDTDRAFACPQLRTNRALAQRVPTYGYEFADRTAPTYAPFFTDLPPGAAHASELAYLFDLAIGPWGKDFQQVELTAEQRALGDEMIRAWTRFARTGSPAADPGAWPLFGTGDDHRVWSFSVQPASSLRTDAWDAHHCDLWAELG